MNRRQAYGLVGAVLLGAVVGVAFAPQAQRRLLARQLEIGVPRFIRVTRQIIREARTATEEILVALSDNAGAWFESLRRRAIIMRAPIGTLKRSLSADPILSRRSIWVDAVGDTILLHGIVDDDDEWRNADTLARTVSPDGSVRNLLQVRRRADA